VLILKRCGCVDGAWWIDGEQCDRAEEKVVVVLVGRGDIGGVMFPHARDLSSLCQESKTESRVQLREALDMLGRA
jgi:hypothetical protein